MIIINLTQHTSTPEQRDAGVVDLPEKTRNDVSDMITFNEIPSLEEMRSVARRVIDLAVMAYGPLPLGQEMMIGGAPFFMATFEEAIRLAGGVPVYAFSRRESVDQPQADGSVKKVGTFRFAGFVRV